jgi:hypothetical protein
VRDLSEEFQGVGFFLEGVGLGVSRAEEGIGLCLQLKRLRPVRRRDKLTGDGETGSRVELGFYLLAGNFVMREDDLEGAEGGAVGDFGEADGLSGAARTNPPTDSEGFIEGWIVIEVGNGRSKAPWFVQPRMFRHGAKVGGILAYARRQLPEVIELVP